MDTAERKTPLARVVYQLHKPSEGRSLGENDINSLSPTSKNRKYHIVFALKYRCKVFYGQKGKEVGEILGTLCNWRKEKIIGAEVCPHHNMFIEIPLNIRYPVSWDV